MVLKYSNYRHINENKDGGVLKRIESRGGLWTLYIHVLYKKKWNFTYGIENAFGNEKMGFRFLSALVEEKIVEIETLKE